MKLNSIKYRLLLISTVCLLGMILLVGNQLHSTQRLIDLNQQRSLLKGLSADLLQLRRHEKDFMLRKDTQYIRQFSLLTEAYRSDIDDISEVLLQHSPNSFNINDLKSAFNGYRAGFLQLAGLYQQIGLDEESGEKGIFRDAAHRLEDYFEQRGRVDNQLLLLQLRRREKDFLLRMELRYVDMQQDLYEQLHTDLSGADDITALNLLEAYQSSFNKLVNYYQFLGLDQDSGLQGQFRNNVHQLEERLSQLDKQLAPIIDSEESKVTSNGFAIMAVTVIALAILLGRSFLVLQRAFSNFVMFFYRCKREYRHIDEKQMGFAEFQSLAAAANEMIDARREIELKLKEVQDKMDKLKKAGADGD